MKNKPKKPRRCVLDTNVLQKANATISTEPRHNSKFVRRVDLLQRVAEGTFVVMYSARLIGEYDRHIKEPRNDYVKAFLEILSKSAERNWHGVWRSDREAARKCKYPAHDDHVLRTAIHPEGCHLFSEENGILASAACIKSKFDVSISDV
jgi:hypothetical protein